MGGRHSKRNNKATKRALLVGCNYPNTKAQLSGCTNDVNNWKDLLTSCFGFEEENIKILVDDGEGGYESPTGKNIKRELKRMVEESRAGDIVFFQFSGHGVQVPADEDGDYEPDGLDEALCPTDLNLIIDDDLRDILSNLDSRVKFTMVSDCCHSGGMLDHQEIVISGGSEADVTRRRSMKERGISVDEVMEDMKPIQDSKAQKNRAIDLETMASMLSEVAKQSPAKAPPLEQTKTRGMSFRSTLYDVYGKDASNASLATRTRDLTEEEAKHIHYNGPGKKPEDSTIDPNKGILITGCQSHETSADVTDAEGLSFGALSHTIVRTLKRHRRKYGDQPISNKELVLKVRQLLNKSGFAQNPCLECSVPNASVNFIVW